MVVEISSVAAANELVCVLIDLLLSAIFETAVFNSDTMSFTSVVVFTTSLTTDPRPPVISLTDPHKASNSSLRLSLIDSLAVKSPSFTFTKSRIIWFKVLFTLLPIPIIMRPANTATIMLTLIRVKLACLELSWAKVPALLIKLAK